MAPNDHARRSTSTSTTSKALWATEDYLWSLDSRSRHIPSFLAPVEEELVKAASIYGFQLHADDLAWIKQYKGRYQFYLHPKSLEARELLKTKRFQSESFVNAPDAVEKYMADEKYTVMLPSPRFGKKAPATQRNYEKFCRQLWLLLAMVGDYTSMLMLLPHPPSNERCPSIRAEMLVAFVFHRYKPALSPTTFGFGDGDHLKDINGHLILAEGSVLGCGWLDSFFAAMTILHQEHGQNGSYRQICDECFAIYKEAQESGVSNHSPCHYHDLQRRATVGNPVTSIQVKDARDWMRNEAIRRNYQVRKRSPFFPSDLVDLQKYLASTKYNCKDLLFYTMILDAMDTGMRFDGYQDVKCEDFEKNSQLWSIHHNRIVSLAQGVKEKHDTKWFTYKLTFKDSVPKLCLLRHLLVHVHCAGIKSGYVFPSDKPGTEEDGHMDSGVMYAEFDKWITDRLKLNTRNNGHANWGPHTPRRSIYLFGVLGGGEFPDVMRNARHEDLLTAKGYFEDAKLLRDEIFGNPELAALQQIWPFVDRLIHGQGANLRRLQTFNSNNVEMTSLQDVATLFVEKMLGVSPDHKMYKDAGYLLERSYGLNFSQKTPFTDFNDFVESLRPHERGECRGKFNSAVTYAQQLALASSQGTAFSATNSANLPNNPAVPSPAYAPTPTLASDRLATSSYPTSPPKTSASLIPPSPQEVANYGMCQGHHQLMHIEIDLSCGKPSKKMAYRIKSSFTKHIPSLVGPAAAYTMFQLVMDVASLATDSSLSFRARFAEGRPRLKSNKHTFQRYVNTFFHCFDSCHSGDIESFIEANPHFKPTVFHKEGGCANCHRDAAASRA